MSARYTAAALVLCSGALAQGKIDFQSQIQPVLEKSCFPCHSADRAAGGLRLSTRLHALKSIVPGKPDQSALVKRIELPAGAPGTMPPGGVPLDRAQRELIRRWVAEGAPWPDTAMPGAAKSTSALDERTLAARLHDRIAANSREKTQSDMKPYKTTIPNTDVSFEMTPIPGGEFLMGTPASEPGHKADEAPQHKVRIEPFWMGTREVTWDEYRLFMFANQAGEITRKDALVDAVSRPTRPYVEMSFGMGINGYPAISMTQHAANKYAEWLSAKTGVFYRLPTEAEWEYACRAGTTTAYSFGEDASKLGDYAWFSGNSNGKYQKVGTKKPNPWGLYDMHGNVMEWTLDQYAPDFYAAAAGKVVTEPWAKAAKPYPHSVRGGSWTDDPEKLRCGARVASDSSWKMQDPQLPKSIWYHTDAQWLGFRLVRPLALPSATEMFQVWNSGVEKE